MTNVLALTNRIAVVVGATSGIGRAIAIGLAGHGAHVIPTGRRQSLLEEVCCAIDKLREYSELYQRLGGYAYDQDPGRPGWTPIIPNDRWADPKDDRPVKIPF